MISTVKTINLTLFGTNLLNNQ